MSELTPIEERFRLANPIPDPANPPMTGGTAAAALLDLEERRGTMQTQEMSQKMASPRRRRNGWLIAAAAVVAVIVVAGSLVIGGSRDETTDYHLAAGNNVLTVVGPPFDIAMWRFEEGGSQTEDGTLTGFEVDLLGEIASRLGLSIAHVSVPRPEILPGLVAGEYDVASMQADITPEREEQVDFITPHARTEIVLIVKPESGITGIADLAGRRIVVTEGTSAEEFMRQNYPGIELVLAGNANSARDMFARNQAEGWVKTLQADDVNAGLVVVETLFELFTGFPMNPALSDLRADMSGTIEDMIADGAYEEIYNRWFDSPEFRVDR